MNIQNIDKTSLVLSGVCYGTYKFASYITSRPVQSTEGHLESRIDQIRERLWECKQSIVKVVGKEKWYTLSVMIAENAWISVLFLRIVLGEKNLPVMLEEKLAVFALFGATSCVAWLPRQLLTDAFPSLEKYIAPSDKNIPPRA